MRGRRLREDRAPLARSSVLLPQPPTSSHAALALLGLRREIPGSQGQRLHPPTAALPWGRLGHTPLLPADVRYSSQGFEKERGALGPSPSSPRLLLASLPFSALVSPAPSCPSGAELRPPLPTQAAAAELREAELPAPSRGSEE